MINEDRVPARAPRVPDMPASRKQFERVGVRWTHDAEVTTVEGGDDVDVKSLGRSYDRAVNRSERELAVSGDELDYAHPVRGAYRLHVEGPTRQVGQKADLGLDAPAGGEEINDFSDHERGDDQRARVRFE